MHRIVVAAGVALGAAALALGVAAPAQASPASHPVPLLIHEHIDFAAVNHFTTAGPLCHAGTWGDVVESATPINEEGNVYLVTIDSVYTCDDGSGTFDGYKVLVVRFGSDGSQASTGSITLTGGTGRYAGLLAAGTDTGGANAAGIGRGIIAGLIERI